MNGSVKEPNKFHNYETKKITRKASDTAEYIELFGSSTRDRHPQRIYLRTFSANMFHNYETEKFTRKASDVAENLQL